MLPERVATSPPLGDASLQPVWHPECMPCSASPVCPGRQHAPDQLRRGHSGHINGPTCLAPLPSIIAYPSTKGKKQGGPSVGHEKGRGSARREAAARGPQHADLTRRIARYPVAAVPCAHATRSLHVCRFYVIRIDPGYRRILRYLGGLCPSQRRQEQGRLWHERHVDALR